jgi:hypothetical protein
MVPFHRRSPPEALVVPVSRFKAVVACRVGLPVTSERAIIGNVEAKIANNIAGRLDKMVSPCEVACGTHILPFRKPGN